MLAAEIIPLLDPLPMLLLCVAAEAHEYLAEKGSRVRLTLEINFDRASLNDFFHDLVSFL